MEGEGKDIFGEEPVPGSSTTVKEYLRKYLSFWPLFVLSLGLCLCGAFFYIRYAVPKYMVKTLILVKGGNNEGHSSQDLIAKTFNGEIKEDVENELQLIKSRGLMEQVVRKNQFNISYYKTGNVRNVDIYNDVPFILTAQEIRDSISSSMMILKKITNEGLTIVYGTDASKTSLAIKWNTPFIVNEKLFKITPRGRTFNSEDVFMVTWNPVNQTAEELSNMLSAEMLDKKTSIIKLELLVENLKRGKDILNAIAREFNQSDIDEKNSISDKKIRFIDDRLSIMYNELNGVEGNLENYQGNNQIVNVATQSNQSFGNSNDVSKSLTDIGIQQGVVEMIQSYFNNSNTEGKLVPSSLGINDATLSTLISRYNELQLKKQRETPLLGTSSPLLQDINNQINDVKGSILESLQNITKNLKLQENSLNQKNTQYSQFLSALPHKERVMQEIKRKQSITEGLYLYLLQKREESSISASSSNVPIYKQIDVATGYGPVEPNTQNIWLYSIVLGLFLPVAIISMRDLLNDKIIQRRDITSRSSIPITGEISHIRKRKTNGLHVMDRGIIAEQFRILRTNLSFLQKNKSKRVMLVTSSVINEGKSIVSLNLAAVLSIPGKKVALLEFDMRNPGICKNLDTEKEKGLTNYLTGQSKNLSELFFTVDELPDLHIYASGPMPANPADLLLNKQMPGLFEELKKQYDYIIVDSPPAAVVTDAFILDEYSDAVIYVIRQQQTLKKQLDFINEASRTEKLKNISFLVNDVKTSSDGYDLSSNFAYGTIKKRSFWKRIIPFTKESYA